MTARQEARRLNVVGSGTVDAIAERAARACVVLIGEASHGTQECVLDRLEGPLLQRAIGVIYRPETERWSHYFEAHLPAPFDLLIRLDRTDALRPLDLWAGWDEGEPPETWPSTL